MNPARKHPVHFPPHAQGNRTVIVFVTACTAKRRPLLARPEAHDCIVNAWRAAHGWMVGRYILIPDHVHFFCVPEGIKAPQLGRWIRYWKSLVSRSWPWPEEQPIWQVDFWDTQLRIGESYGAKWEYVRMNAVRHGHQLKGKIWPYQGELNLLDWHD